MPVPRVSLVATILNEQERLNDWIGGLDSQTRPPDEMVIVDGGSSDGTWEALQTWRPDDPTVLRLSAPGANIARGRNIGIEATTGTIIAVTDAGTVADPLWLERLVDALSDPRVDVAAGFFVPTLEGRWQRALSATTLPEAGEIDPHRFLPSSRSLAFRKCWWDVGVRYPDWLDYCEDVVFDLALRRAGARFTFAPDALVTFAVRPSAIGHARQYARYARGDGKAGLFAARHLARYVTYAAAAGTLRKPSRWRFAIVAILGLLYLRKPLGRLVQRDRQLEISYSETVITAWMIPPTRVLGDISKMVGYPIGLCWRWRRLGGLGWRTTWRRINPQGRLWRPGRLSTGSQDAIASPCAESPLGSR